MAILSIQYITPLKIVSLCFMVIGYILHAVGITAKEWDGIHGHAPLYNLDFDAYQNLWGKYEKDAMSAVVSVYGRVDTGIPNWKKNSIIIESSGVGLAFLSSVLVFIATFVTPVSRRKSIKITLSILAFLLLLAAGAESIVGVKLYLENYESVFGGTFQLLLQDEAKQGVSGLYNLTWAPYVCISAGGLYILAGVILIIDIIITVVNKNSTEVVPVTV